MNELNEKKAVSHEDKPMTNIGVRSFVTVVLILIGVLIFSGVLSYMIPQGTFERDENEVIIPDTSVEGEIEGISFLKVLTAPLRVFVSDDALTVIMISVFLLVTSISYWETCKQDPSAEAIFKLATFFNVSADYILGITDY